MMSEIKITPQILNGSISVSGAKNSSLRFLAASLLTNEKLKLYNMPTKILDHIVHVEMLEHLGKNIEILGSSVIIEESDIKNSLIWEKRSIRNSLLILGALLTRNGFGKVPLPGGCKLGERKYDLHVKAMEMLGASVWEEGEYLCAESKGRLKGNDIFLSIRSTGATENSILMATLAEGTTRIWNPHIRPEIIDLIALLKKMGAKIEVRGQESIIVEGVESLHGAEHKCIPDNVEALTWVVAGAVAGGEIEIKNFPLKHLEVPLIHLREAGLKYYISEDRDSVIVRKSEVYPIDIATGPYPGINSDMQPLFAVYGLMAKGESRIIDLRFPGRYGYAEELAKMGAEYEIKGDLLILKGGKKLKGAEVKALDLRAGAALIIAGLVAEGETKITNFEQVERGYENVAIKLRDLIK
jgi:UDP-N-acetylglucosamine 1-carboxyvinyltransferase